MTETTGLGRHPSKRAAAPPASRAVEVAFGLLVAGAFFYTLHLTDHFYFYADDWLLIKQAGSVRGLFEPYNDHLSIIILGLWRAFVGGFGFDYAPFRVAGALVLFAVPSAFFVTTRRQFGIVLAALLGIPLVWYGRYVSLNPSELNHYLALLGGVGCAAALNRGRRANPFLAAALVLSLLSAGGGVAVAAACLVHNVCTRPPVRRWLAVGIPTGLWLTWWLIEVHGGSHLGKYALSTSQTLQFVRDLCYTPFQAVALGVPAIAVVLMIAFFGYAIWTISKGANASANVLAWSLAVLVWAVGVANSRGVLADPTVFRYRYVALGFALLAIVPRQPIPWPGRLPIDTDWRWIGAGALAVLALGGARALAVRPDMRASSAQYGSAGRLARGEVLVVGLGPSIVPDATILPFGLGALPAREMRDLLSDHDNPFSTTVTAADQRLVAMSVVRTAGAGRRSVACTPLTSSFTYAPKGVGTQYVWSADHTYEVDVRRFGATWVRLAQGRPGTALQLVLPGLNAGEPWEVRANGACRVGPAAH